jgi:putative FmdB family regulatory protein
VPALPPIMPIYEYLCKACRHRFERLILSPANAPKCPACESEDLERLISTCAVHSESASQANLQAAHRKAAANRHDRQQREHQHFHEHFEDRATVNSPPRSDHDVTESGNY